VTEDDRSAGDDDADVETTGLKDDDDAAEDETGDDEDGSGHTV
jgi:hypothetical protein